MEPDPEKRKPPRLPPGRLKWVIGIGIAVVAILYGLSDLIGGPGLLG